MSKSSGKIYQLSRPGVAEVPKFLTDWSASVLARNEREARKQLACYPRLCKRGRLRSSYSKMPDLFRKRWTRLVSRESSINFTSTTNFHNKFAFGLSVIEVGCGFRDGEKTMNIVSVRKH